MEEAPCKLLRQKHNSLTNESVGTMQIICCVAVMINNDWSPLGHLNGRGT